jgi:subtilisin family serine protease
MAVRISDTGGISGSAVTDGIMWAADHGANVINISLGGYLTAIGDVGVPFISDWDVAVLYATARGALVVASAGNGVQNKVGYPGSPACASPAFDPAALCVGATDEYDMPAGFTNYGVRIDVMAPGVGIWTTSKFGFATPEQGTSLSSPMVAGVAALLMSMGATNVVAANILRATAKDLGNPGYDLTYGFGRVDAAAAVALCKQVCASVR